MDPTKQLETRTAAFELAQRQAKALAASTLVPDTFRQNVGDCLIAMELAERLNAPVLQVMQHLNVIHGKPGFSASFIIALINYSGILAGRLTFEKSGDGIMAVGIDAETGERLEGTVVSLDMAKREGWAGRKGSKWASMPDQMLRYRAATFWQRIYAPELSVGLGSVEDIHDDVDVMRDVTPEGAKKLARSQAPVEDADDAIDESDPVAAAMADLKRRQTDDSDADDSDDPADPAETARHEADAAEANAERDEPTTWPREADDGNWYDSTGARYEPVKHGWSKENKAPAVTKAGVFRARRGSGAHVPPETPKTESAKPDDEAGGDTPDEASFNGSAMFRGLMTRVAGAMVPADLEGIKAHPALESLSAEESKTLNAEIKRRAQQMAG